MQNIECARDCRGMPPIGLEDSIERDTGIVRVKSGFEKHTY